jgi:1,5-anhydro-D-fructose reductase (1,5-anhydro-D-mannitol-forming)
MSGVIAGRKLRVGIMSFAHVHAAIYARLLAHWPGVEVRAADPGGAAAPVGESRGHELAASLGVGYADSYEDLLAWKPDAVIVASETAHHRLLVEAAAAAGAAVLCEKPLATTRRDAVAMQAACDAAGVTLMTAYPVRFSPTFERLQEIVSNGGVGQLLGATGTNNGQIPVGERAWFTDPELSGGGALVDHVVHVADLIDALTGLRPLTVHAATNRILHSDKPQVRAETGGLVTVVYEGGFILTIDCSWSQPDSAPIWGGLTLDVVGSKGLVEIDPFAQHIGGFTELDPNGLHLSYAADTDELLLAAFIDGARKGHQPQPDGQVGIRTLAIVIAAQESARTGHVVDID